MAIGIYFAPSSMTVAQYEETVERLTKAGAGHPKGRRYHACFGEADKVQIFDVWDSQDSFDAFGQTLMPILADMGLDVTAPVVMPVHSIIAPPAQAAPRRAATPARATKAKAAGKPKAARNAKAANTAKAAKKAKGAKKTTGATRRRRK